MRDVKLKEVYHHVDNGGVSFTFSFIEDDSGCKAPVIKMESSYFGYPCVSASLIDWNHLPSSYFREVALGFLKLADAIDEHIADCVKKEIN